MCALVYSCLATNEIRLIAGNMRPMGDHGVCRVMVK